MSSQKKNKKEYIRRKLLSKYRLVFMDEETYEEKASLRLSRMNIFVVGTLFSLFLIIATTLFIIYTPLRQYILGFSEVNNKQETINLAFKIDSLENQMRKNDLYLNSIKKVLTGDILYTQINKDSIYESNKIDPKTIDLSPSRQDSLLRQEVAEEDRYNVFEKALYQNKEILLFPPISKGVISNEFKPQERHFGIDIAAPEGTAVKSVADGTVIFAEWTVATGNVIIIEHKQNLVSVYKHNATLVKQQGDQVRTGEVIATIGNTGEFSTGTHLHFELWSNGYPANPRNYIEFK
ncbi:MULTISPECIES: M23 family metallopeptidase [Capnocytophaga]|uniref:M23 family peptidase n=1 Tax=Capnocytophaga canis TaxID=1848903 RepID=A0A0B7IK59_9FLAO|nr:MULTISPECIES: M23 family metallopeptidase [Capnocytophaga]ATA72764.1 M23 family peptidase [Capnocytophaga sp. H4358]ATA74860.1 M23 family peptidase [Capnocytophaga sp. H2931]RIY35645.1 M23 family peptidase [Capnocytophaga canis]CEN43325.1 putative peptidase [Capnocytophaga canis]CEN44711.1 putative peptidase [Capnocytophaga canis]